MARQVERCNGNRTCCWVAATNLEVWKEVLKEAKTLVSCGSAAAADDDDGYLF